MRRLGCIVALIALLVARLCVASPGAEAARFRPPTKAAWRAQPVWRAEGNQSFAYFGSMPAEMYNFCRSWLRSPWTPPVTPESTGYQASPFDDTANVGVPVAPFPRWLLCPYCRLLAPIKSGLFELKLDPYRRDRSRYVHRICKKPGKPPDMSSPFTCPIGSTLVEMAALVHRDFTQGLKSARIWGTGVYDGQSVKRDHVLHDKDIVELHL